MCVPSVCYLAPRMFACAVAWSFASAMGSWAEMPPLPLAWQHRPARRVSSQRSLKSKYKVAFDELVFHETIGKGSYKVRQLQAASWQL